MTETIQVSVNKGGRPSVDRQRAFTLAKSQLETGKPSTQYICRVLRIQDRTWRKLKKEYIDSRKELGETVKKPDYDLLDVSVRDFEEELKATTDLSFLGWLKGKTKTYRQIFNFCQKEWIRQGKPSLYWISQRDSQGHQAEQFAQSFIESQLQEPRTRRYRKTLMSYLLTFLGRKDVYEKFLKVTQSRDPRPVKEVPEILMTDFPKKFEKAIDLMKERLGEEGSILIKLKLVTLMRTGDKGESRELWGIKVGEPNHTYLIMKSSDEYVFKIHAKMNESWTITWIPREVRKELFELYKTREKGSQLIQLNVNQVRRVWKEVTQKVGLPALSLHDIRKVALSWLWMMGIQLEVATDINVGWKDLNTAKRHYIQFRGAIQKDMKERYRNDIPAWFKDGLDQYVD